MSGKSINSWNSNLKMSRTPTKASTRDDKAKTSPLKSENNLLKKDDIFLFLSFAKHIARHVVPEALTYHPPQVLLLHLPLIYSNRSHIFPKLQCTVSLNLLVALQNLRFTSLSSQGLKCLLDFRKSKFIQNVITIVQRAYLSNQTS